jgi:hypothetical protein
MRNVHLVFACFAVLASCKDNNAKTETATADSTTIATPTATQPEEAPAALLTPVDSIKQEVARINAANLPSKRHDFMCDEKAYVVYHYDGDTIVKATIDWGTVGDAYHREEFYYRNGKLIFDYDLLEGAGAYPGGDEKLERRHYVVNDKVIRYLENQEEKPCEYCDYKKTSVPYKALAAETSKDFVNVLCR